MGAWAFGRESFGIRPAKPLKSLLIQAENDDGDLVEMRDGVFHGLQLTADEREKANGMIFIFHETTKTSDSFFKKVVAPLLETHQPDLLVIDPALAYLGGESNSQKDVGAFLRNGLNPLLSKYRCGALVVHHTNKPPRGKEKDGYLAGDFAYLGGGSAEWANWSRCVLAVQSVGSHSVFKLHAAKRGTRIGWRNEDGSKRFEQWIGHSESGAIYWREATEAEVEDAKAKKPGAPIQHSSEQVLEVLQKSAKPLRAGEWKEKCIAKLGISARTFDTRKKDLQDFGEVVVENGLWRAKGE